MQILECTVTKNILYLDFSKDFLWAKISRARSLVLKSFKLLLELFLLSDESLVLVGDLLHLPPQRGVLLLEESGPQSNLTR